MSRVANFTAGPAALPLAVLEEAQRELLDFQGTGMSIMENSHRSKTYEVVHNDAIALMISLCREYRCPTHIVHLSSADALPAIRAARAEGLPLTVETCPHYLTFCAEEIADGDTRLKCAPPIRERENRERLWNTKRCSYAHCPGWFDTNCPIQFLRLLPV